MTQRGIGRSATARPGTKRLALLTGLALVAVIAAGAVTGSRTVAAGLQPTATRALAAAGLDMVQVHMVGREARLSGGALQDRVRAEHVIENVRGIRRATLARPSSPSVRAAEPGGRPRDTAPLLDLRLAGDGLRISGTVATADEAAELKARAAEALDTPVRGDVDIDAAVGTATWVDEVPEIFADLGGVSSLTVHVGRQSQDASAMLAIGGMVRSRAGEARIMSAVKVLVPELQVVSTLSIDPGDLTAADATILDSTSVVFADGTALISAEGSAALAQAAEVLRRNPLVDLVVSGHSGPDAQAARQLGQARVLAVRSALVDAGVAADQLVTVDHSAGRRPAGPIEANDRRVNLVVRRS